MIVGLSGTSLVGREEVASYLIEKGFGYYSFSNELEKELEEKGASPVHVERQAMLLRQHGKWLRRIISEVTEQNVIIDGIKTVEDVKLLKQRKDFLLIGVYSPIEVKFERAAAKELLTDELKDNDEFGHQLEELSKVFSMIDESIVYPSSDVAIKRKLDEVVKKAGKNN